MAPLEVINVKFFFIIVEKFVHDTLIYKAMQEWPFDFKYKERNWVNLCSDFFQVEVFVWFEIPRRKSSLLPLN